MIQKTDLLMPKLSKDETGAEQVGSVLHENLRAASIRMSGL